LELSQSAFLADDAQRAVPGGDQLDRRLDDLPEHHFQLQLAAECDHRFQQRVRPVPGVEYRLQPGLEFGQQVVEAQMGQQRDVAFALFLHALPPGACHLGIVTSGRPG
jgi:hypothetical protein